jgi:putative selenium metabolism protein SsnA
MSSQLIVNARVFTGGSHPRFYPDGALLLDEGKIAGIGSQPELRKAHPQVELVDLGGRLVLPGRINAHDHLYSYLARGIAMKDAPPHNFLEILERLWWRLDAALTEEDVYYSGLMGFMEAARKGVTSVVDHHAGSSSMDGSLDQLARGSLEVGVRACLCYEVTDRHGIDGALRGIAENVRFHERCRKNPDDRLAPAFGLHASITVPPEILAKSLEAISDPSLFYHVHVGEDRCDVNHSRKTYGCPPLERLLREGLGERRVLAAHCIHLTAGEQQLLSQHDITVLHNPRSNMNNAVGCVDLPKLLKLGVRVGVGTDGMSQDPTDDTLELAIVHKLMAHEPQALPWSAPYDLAFVNNPQIASDLFGHRLGTLVHGSAADLMVLDYDPPTPLDADNFLGHYLFGLARAPVHATMVGGRFIYRKNQLLGVDEKEVLARGREVAAKLWQRW